MAVTLKKGGKRSAGKNQPFARTQQELMERNLPATLEEIQAIPPFALQRGVRKVPKPVQPKPLTEDAFIEKDRQKEALRALRQEFDLSPLSGGLPRHQGPLNLPRGDWQLDNPGEVIPKTKIPLPLAKLLSNARIARQSREFTKGTKDPFTGKMNFNPGPLNPSRKLDERPWSPLPSFEDWAAPWGPYRTGGRSNQPWKFPENWNSQVRAHTNTAQMREYLQKERDIYSQRNPWGGRLPTSEELVPDVPRPVVPGPLGGTGLFEGRPPWTEEVEQFRPAYPEHSWKVGPSKDPYTRQLRLRTLEDLQKRSRAPLTEQQTESDRLYNNYNAQIRQKQWAQKEKAFQETERTRPRTPWGSPKYPLGPPPPRNQPWLNLP